MSRGLNHLFNRGMAEIPGRLALVASQDRSFKHRIIPVTNNQHHGNTFHLELMIQEWQSKIQQRRSEQKDTYSSVRISELHQVCFEHSTTCLMIHSTPGIINSLEIFMLPPNLSKLDVKPLKLERLNGFYQPRMIRENCLWI